MTIGSWIVFFAVVISAVGLGIFSYILSDSTFGKAASIIVAVVIVFGTYFGFRWYYTNTASGQRALISEKSNLNNGLHRTLVVYTANGEVLATYEGVFDIQETDGGSKVLFDYDGKRYVYYNCYIESIADIE